MQFSATDLFSAHFCRAMRPEMGRHNICETSNVRKQASPALILKKCSKKEQQCCASLRADDFYIEVLERN